MPNKLGAENGFDFRPSHIDISLSQANILGVQGSGHSFFSSLLLSVSQASYTAREQGCMRTLLS